MKDAERQFEDIERRLRMVRLAEPSAECKARILGAARETWKTAPAEIPWRIPLRHLGLSAAAAVVIVSCANYFSERAVAPWQAGRPAPARMVAADWEGEAEIPSSPFVRHLVATCWTSTRDTSALIDYLQSVQETVNGAEPDEAAEGSGPEEQESREKKIGIMEHRKGGILAGLETISKRCMSLRGAQRRSNLKLTHGRDCFATLAMTCRGAVFTGVPTPSTPTFHCSMLLEGVAPCIDDPRES